MVSAMASEAIQKLVSAQDGIAHRVERRRANEWKAKELTSEHDAEQRVEFACECKSADCEKSVIVPLYVYRRIIDARDQYLLRAGHHAFASYRTILEIGLTRIEARV
jgi:hypothetical protein